MLLPITNPLAYPGGILAPGFDPTHVAAAGISAGHGISVIASGTNLINLLTGKAGTPSGTNTASILGAIGPTMGQNAAGSFCTFAGNSTATDTTGTCAIIFQTPNAFTSGAVLVGSTSGGFALETASSASTSQARMIFFSAGGPLTSTFGTLLAANIPYFLAGSIQNGSVNETANFVLVSLLTGQTQTSSASSTKVTPGAAGGTYTIGTTADKLGYVAAAMMAPSFMSLLALQQWAQAPWDFWYPPIGSMSMNPQHMIAA